MGYNLLQDMYSLEDGTYAPIIPVCTFGLQANKPHYRYYDP